MELGKCGRSLTVFCLEMTKAALMFHGPRNKRRLERVPIIGYLSLV
jgi:hypothetical protein